MAKSHDRFKRDLLPAEILLVHLAEHPVLTTANKNTVEVYIANIQDEQDIGPDVAELCYRNLWRAEIGRRISEYGVRLIDGEHSDLDGISSIIASVGSDFVPTDVASAPVDTDPVKLFERLNQRGKWAINIPQIKDRIRYVSPGNFIIVLARPESGKTATIVNLMAGKEGFAAQGARVHLLANEEGADITAGRAICCFNEVSFQLARENPTILRTDSWDALRKKLVFVHQPEITLTQLDAYLKTHKPDILIIDQIDHLGIVGSYEKGHERLGAVYRRVRELASKHDCVIIGVSQASAEGEGKTKITFAMAEGSKTAKAAAADLIIGIGKADENNDEEGDQVLRYFTVSKNKISGWKGTVVAKLIQSESRLVA